MSHFDFKCRVTARLHGIEVYYEAAKIAWENVHLICSKPEELRFSREEILPPASLTITNLGVDVEPTMTPKTFFGHNIGIVAVTIHPRKRVYTTIESFIDLLTTPMLPGTESKWTLHIHGASQTGFRNAESFEYMKYLEELGITAYKMKIPADRIVFHNYDESKGKYLNFLKGLDIIISNSMQEGYHQAIFEAMSYGVYPLVHNWLGADTLFPEESLFFSQRELVDEIMEWDKMSLADKAAKAIAVQHFVREYHDQEKCAQKVVDVILG
jgi:glycosyltransferase involved in cell wall biosynthesis